jgi:hypothetical protein
MHPWVADDDACASTAPELAVIGTGGDPGHAPARAATSRPAARPLPLVRHHEEL